MSANPAIAGIAGDEPVAMMKRRALMVTSSTAIVLASRKRAAPAMTRTPRPVKRSRESCGATASMAWCTWALTAAKSMPKRPLLTPKRAPLRKELARSAAAINAFDGKEPLLRLSPPILPFSMSTTGTPMAAAAAAAASPPAPAPITQISVLSSLFSCAISRPNSPQLVRMFG